MNNIQLQELFESVLEISNSFDRILKLKQLQKEYKKSAFYKHTKMNIFKAYELFVKDSIATEAMHIKRFANAEFLGEYVTNFLDHLPADVLEDFANRFVEAFNVNEMLAASTEIGAQLKQLQR